MDPKVVIETGVLRGSRNDSDLQRVATVYLNNRPYRVMAPSVATGAAVDWQDQFIVREPSTSDFAFGAEVPVSIDTAEVVVKAVVEELRREEAEADFWDWGKHPNARFYYAQICLHGDVITAGGLDKIRRDERCELCGSRCIDRCEKCNAPIRGKRTGGSQRGEYQVPSFCHKCGTPYPWMQDRLDTARELLWHDDKLSIEDRESLWNLLQYVMTNPKSDLAPAKRKLIDIKLQPALTATREFILDFLAKLAKEMSQPT